MNEEFLINTSLYAIKKLGPTTAKGNVDEELKIAKEKYQKSIKADEIYTKSEKLDESFASINEHPRKVNFSESREIIKKINQLKTLQERIMCLKNLAESLKNVELVEIRVGESEINSFADAINDKRLDPIISKDKKLKIFRELMQKTQNFRCNTENYYDRFKKELIKHLEMYYRRNNGEDDSIKFANLLDKLNECEEGIAAMKNNWNENNKFDENCKYVFRKYFDNCIVDFAKKSPSSAAFTMEKSFIYIYDKLPRNSSPLCIALNECLSTLDILIPRKFPDELKTIEKKFDYFFKVTEIRSNYKLNTDSDYSWARDLKNELVSQYKEKGHEGINKTIIAHGRKETFADIFKYCRKKKEKEIFSDMFTKYPCLGYVYNTQLSELDRECEEYKSARNVFKYGLFTSFMRYKARAMRKIEGEDDTWMKEIVSRFVSEMDRKFGEESDLKVIINDICGK